jgi:hypothetical protein
MNAINDALAPFSVHLTEMPFSPDRMLAALGKVQAVNVIGKGEQGQPEADNRPEGGIIREEWTWTSMEASLTGVEFPVAN